MNKFDHNNTKELQKMMLAKFDETVSYENIFNKRRNEILKAFAGVALYIPWYLIPFKGMIRNIALYAFEKGMEEHNKNDTVTIKRPSEYKSNG